MQPSRRLTWLVVLSTLLFVLAAWLDLTPWLRGPDEWRWTLRTLIVPLWRILFPILLLGLYAFVCARSLRAFDDPAPTRGIERRFLVFLTLAAPVIQFALAAAVWRNPLFEFFGATVSPAVTGYYSVAVTTPNLPDYFPRYTEFMPTLPIHPQTHPPGLVMIHWLGWRLFEAMPAVSDAIAMPLRALQCHNAALMTLDNSQIASAAVGMLVPLLGAFTVWPMYAFGKRVIGPAAAATASALFPILPAFAIWPGQWDQVYPLFLFLALYLTHTGLEAGSLRRIFAAGVSLSIATFLSVGNAALVVIVGLYGLLWIVVHHQDTTPQKDAGQATPRKLRVLVSRLARPRREASDRVWWLIVFALGCASIWIGYAALYRVNILGLITAGTRLAHESTRCPVCPSTTRSYAVWVIWNVIDVATFFSVPLTLLFFTRVPAIIAAIRDSLKGESPDRVRWAPLALAALLTFIVLDVSGIVRGEVGRMWGYFGALFALIAFAPGRGSPFTSNIARRPIVWIALVALQLVTMSTRWIVTPSFLDEPPERQASFATPDPQVDLDVSFGEQIALLGYDLASHGDALDVLLYWKALAQPPHAYTVFVHVLDAQGQLVGQQDNMPVHDQLLTSCWQPGEVVADPHQVAVAADAPGPLSIEVGLYRVDTGERLARDDGAGTSVTLSTP